MAITLTSPAVDEFSDTYANRPRVKLFELDGTAYYADAQPSASILVRFMRDSQGDELGATHNLLSKLLGDDAYEALANWEPLTGQNLKDIVQAATQLIMGTDGGPKGGRTA